MNLYFKLNPLATRIICAISAGKMDKLHYELLSATIAQ